MTAIDAKYQQLIQANPWIGSPIGPEQTCQDGKGHFRDYQGGASIYYTPDTGAHLINGLIRAKWIQLGREKGPNGYPVTDEADAISGKGRFNNFQSGTIIWKRGTPEAFSVYGDIYVKWGTLQYDSGPLGFPLTDEAATTVPNTGRFNDFDHGAIYYITGVGTHVILSPILDLWSIYARDQGPYKYPTSDTQPMAGNKNTYTQTFLGGSVRCRKDKSRSIVSTSLVTSRVKPISRALELADDCPDDTRVCNPQLLNNYVELKTALVIFRESYTRTIDDAEIEELKASYLKAATEIGDLSFGLGRIKPTLIVSNSKLEKSDFVDYDLYGRSNRDGDPATFEPSFHAYDKVRRLFQSLGKTVDDFDIVSIDIPWENTDTEIAGVACADPILCLGNTKTWTTIHFIHPWINPDSWRNWVHEMTHCIEWMLESKGFPKLLNPDDPWWEARYPKLTTSTVVPPPENLKDPGDPRLYAMHMRIKSDWFTLFPEWGKQVAVAIIADTGVTPVRTKFLMYSCADTRTVIETSWTAGPRFHSGTRIHDKERINLHTSTHEKEIVKKKTGRKVRTPR